MEANQRTIPSNPNFDPTNPLSWRQHLEAGPIAADGLIFRSRLRRRVVVEKGTEHGARFGLM